MSRPPDLDALVLELEGRPRELPETASLPRSRLPGLFRAIVAAGADDETVVRALRLLGERLPDRVLLEPTVELLREVEAVRGPLLAALEARGSARDAWTVEKQALILGATLAGLETLLDLTREEPLSLLPRETLERLVETRLETSRRDRTSLEVARGALRLLARSHGKEPAVTALAARVVEAETRRAGKEEPEVALAALDLLALAPPLPLLRAARRLERRVERKMVQERLDELAQRATAALEASKEDVNDLLADDLGLTAEGTLEVELDEGRALVAIDEKGEVVLPAVVAKGADERELASAKRRLEEARRDHARRLERALSSGRSWRLDLWRAIFLENPLLRDLARRLVWIASPEKIAFRPPKGRGELEDVFGSRVVGLGERSAVKLAHPLELDPDELGLWRERIPELGRQPFPQLHRLVAKETEPLERFLGRELRQEDMAALGKERGYRGLPLRGDGPWELARDMKGEGAVFVLVLDRIAAPLVKETRRDALRVLDDPNQKPREMREASPRARVAKVEVLGSATEIARAEAALDLHRLTDPLAAGSDAFFGEWQKKKFKDPARSWREAQLLMMRGSQAAVSVRAALVRAFEKGVRIEGRLAILGGDLGVYVDLGTGQAFEGQLRDWVPPWKLEERARGTEVDAPFDPATDEETIRIVAIVVRLHRVLESAPR